MIAALPCRLDTLRHPTCTGGLPAPRRGAEERQPFEGGQPPEPGRVLPFAGVHFGRRQAERQVLQHADVFPQLRLGQRPQRVLRVKELRPGLAVRRVGHVLLPERAPGRTGSAPLPT